MKRKTIQRLRRLDFDLENRPLTYGGPDFTFGEITALAASFGPGSTMYCWLLGRDDPIQMLKWFKILYDHADIVTGHYIRKHDLPILNAAMIEYGLPALGPKRVIDTKQDLPPLKGLSVSQESLGALFRLDDQKMHMTQQDWREANRLTGEGLRLTEQRVMSDVRMHMQLFDELASRGYLTESRMWEPGKRA